MNHTDNTSNSTEIEKARRSIRNAKIVANFTQGFTAMPLIFAGAAAGAVGGMLATTEVFNVAANSGWGIAAGTIGFLVGSCVGITASYVAGAIPALAIAGTPILTKKFSLANSEKALDIEANNKNRSEVSGFISQAAGVLTFFAAAFVAGQYIEHNGLLEPAAVETQDLSTPKP